MYIHAYIYIISLMYVHVQAQIRWLRSLSRGVAAPLGSQKPQACAPRKGLGGIGCACMHICI